MNNYVENAVYQVPAFEQRKAYSFVENNRNSDVYQELNQIAEEIEQCRLRNC